MCDCAHENLHYAGWDTRSISQNLFGSFARIPEWIARALQWPPPCVASSTWPSGLVKKKQHIALTNDSMDSFHQHCRRMDPSAWRHLPLLLWRGGGWSSECSFNLFCFPFLAVAKALLDQRNLTSHNPIRFSSELFFFVFYLLEKRIASPFFVFCSLCE